MSPTALSLARLRRDGFTADVVERWIPGANIRRDYLGCIDLLAVRAGEPVLAVQATSDGHVSTRVAKAVAEPRLRAWLASGSRFQVWGWSRRDVKWCVRVVPITPGDVAGKPVVHPPPRRKRKPLEPSLFGPAWWGDVGPGRTTGRGADLRGGQKSDAPEASA